MRRASGAAARASLVGVTAWARAELHLCAVTSDLDDDDERKASLATPAAAARTMHRAWEMAPTGPRIVEDILRYPPALQDVIDVGGAEVPDKERGKGRRSCGSCRQQPEYIQSFVRLQFPQLS